MALVLANVLHVPGAVLRLQARYGACKRATETPPDAIREAKKEIQVKIKSVFNFAALLSSLSIFCAHGRHRGLTTGFLNLCAMAQRCKNAG